MLTTRITLRRFSGGEIKGPFNFIAGSPCFPRDPVGFNGVTEPSTGELLAEVASSGPETVNWAVESAVKGFEDWRTREPRERAKVLLGVSRLLERDLEKLARLEVRDSGKPIWEARVDVKSCADAFEYFGCVAAALRGGHVQLLGGNFGLVKREPFGVVGGIGAWNFPIQNCSSKVAPALAAGNSMVFKPSEFTPMTAMSLGELLKEAGLPDGVYNVVQGGAETGKQIVEHPQVSKVSFTGSVPTGSWIMSSAAKKIIPVTLELGGKSPVIIFEDAEMNNAVKAALLANFLSQGAVCSNGTRVYVHKNVYEEFVERVVDATKAMKIGDPMNEDTVVGATISKQQAEKVLGYVARAKESGAVVLCGGDRVILPHPLDQGFYLSPCVLTNVKDDSEIVKHEVFGAVMCVMSFESEDEVVNRANDSDLGLAGAVFTKDLARGHRIADKLEVGSVWINNYNLFLSELPFGGFKKSGFGRENGVEGLECYTQTKSVYVETGDVDCGPLMTS
ncbi:unnamed protein product [Notodromas monacha]|uniref:Aldehyde dehydrogenase domain-containing protein n=1 Tax=Notodromas monacha TaxID=399045 RepID=A0A7R9C1X1_9CRUS|nr:unnamed protein product [Notodromas monacha]CAG0924302.1 unnamed protein product [Notodromas monacha]